MLRGLAFFVMLASLPSRGAVFDSHLEAQSDLKKELRQYEGKLFLLKSPSSFDVIHFDQQGHPTREPIGVPWTTSGLVRASRVDIREHQIVIDGVREVVALDPESPTPKLIAANTDRPVHITIDFPNTLDPAERSELLSRVFLVEDVAQKVANAWHPRLT